MMPNYTTWLAEKVRLQQIIERATNKLYGRDRYNLTFDERVELEFAMAKAERELFEWNERYRLRDRA